MGKLIDVLFPCARTPVNPLPQNDPFYGYDTKPEALERYKPGHVIRNRKIRLADFPGFNASSMQAWELAYRTVAQDGKTPMVTVTVVIVPPKARKDRLVVYLPKTDSASPQCRTSYSLRKGGASAFGALSEQLFMEPLLDRGYMISCVDAESQNDAFGAGPQAGYATLDSIRAVASFSPLHIPTTVQIVGWGYSGGALAAGWAAQLQRAYLGTQFARNIVGWALGGVPADFGALALKVNATIAAGLIMGGLSGLANAYPELQDWLGKNLSERGKTVLAVTKEACFYSVMEKSFQDDVLGMRDAAAAESAAKEKGLWNVLSDSLAMSKAKKLAEASPSGKPLRRTAASIVSSSSTGVSSSSSTSSYFLRPDPLTDPLVSAVIAENKMGASDVDIPVAPLFIYYTEHDEVIPTETHQQLITKWRSKGVVIETLISDNPLIGHILMCFNGWGRAVQWMEDRLEGRPNPAATPAVPPAPPAKGDGKANGDGGGAKGGPPKPYSHVVSCGPFEAGWIPSPDGGDGATNGQEGNGAGGKKSAEGADPLGEQRSAQLKKLYEDRYAGARVCWWQKG